MDGNTTERITTMKKEENISSPHLLKHTDGLPDQCHRPGSSLLLPPIHSAGTQAALHSQRTRLITALIWGVLMLAHANAKDTEPLLPRLPPYLVLVSEIKRLAAQTKTVKFRLWGCTVVIDRSAILSPPLTLFLPLFVYFCGCLSQCQG